VADRSLIYFLFFVFLWLTYSLYEQHVENQRLFELALNQRERLEKQQELINAQQIYLKLLEKEVLSGYNNSNPLHTQPL
jgi:uncharacterized membrane protein